MAAPKMLNPDSAAGNAKIKAPVVKKPKVAVVKRPASSAEKARAAGLKAGTVGAANPVKLLASQVTRSRENALEFLTGIQTRGNKVKVDPLGLAMALPVGKVGKAALALINAGKAAEAFPLVARLAAKGIGNPVSRKIEDALGKLNMEMVPPTKPGRITGRDIQAGRYAREDASSVFPRLPNTNIPGATRSFDIYADPLLEGAGRFSRGTKRGNKLVKAIEKNEVQQGFYIGSKEAIKRAAFNSTRKPSNLPKAK